MPRTEGVIRNLSQHNLILQVLKMARYNITWSILYCVPRTVPSVVPGTHSFTRKSGRRKSARRKKNK
jgi:hypothetical protein